MNCALSFIVKNMDGHYSVNKDWDKELFEVYEKHVEISEKHLWSVDENWGVEIDSLKDRHKNQFKTIHVSNVSLDVDSIQTAWLEENIHLAFTAWQENEFTKNCSFDLFCNYILPYRFKDGIILDDSRRMFYNRHTGFFNHDSLPLIRLVDSLLFEYKDIYFNYYYGASIPIYSVAALEKIKRGTCEDRSWFNSILFASLGMAVSTDFVPARGNRNNSHSWNTLIMDDKIYPFDPFWIEDRWNYTDIYDNKAIDETWGKFRLPKVYRYTYAIQENGPLFNKSVKKEDIPPLFLNPRIKDVSQEYYDTVNIELTLLNSPEYKNIPYAYICVYGYRSWIPVQWGEIHRNKAIFEGMGKDIVYIGAYYKNGRIIPASDPFYLDENGEITPIKPNKKKGTLQIHSIGCFMDKEEKIEVIQPHKDATIMGINKKKGIRDTLHVLSKNRDVWENCIYLSQESCYDRIEIVLPSDTVAFCEFAFYYKINGNPERIPDIQLITGLSGFDESESSQMILDGLSATGFKGKIQKSTPVHTVIFDLGKEYTIHRIDYIPYTKSRMWKNCTYKLYYWDNGWEYHSTKEGNNSVLSFESVPIGTLYRIETEEVRSQKNMERIFLYENGFVRWM